MLRIVLDTDVLLSAVMSPDGASRQLVLAALDGRLRPLVSTPLLLEYEAVLTRPANLARAGLSAGEIGEVLDALLGYSAPVVCDYRWRPTGGHADDEFVVETAINGQADVVATFNLRHMRRAGASFGFEAQRPGPLMRRIRQ